MLIRAQRSCDDAVDHWAEKGSGAEAHDAFLRLAKAIDEAQAALVDPMVLTAPRESLAHVNDLLAKRTVSTKALHGAQARCADMVRKLAQSMTGELGRPWGSEEQRMMNGAQAALGEALANCEVGLVDQHDTRGAELMMQELQVAVPLAAYCAEVQKSLKSLKDGQTPFSAVRGMLLHLRQVHFPAVRVRPTEHQAHEHQLPDLAPFVERGDELLAMLEQMIHTHDDKSAALAACIKENAHRLHRKKDLVLGAKELEAAIGAATVAWVDAAAIKEAQKLHVDLRAVAEMQKLHQQVSGGKRR